MFLNAHPKDPLAPVAELALGRLQMQAGETREALDRFDRVALHSELGLLRHNQDQITITPAGMPLLDALLGEIVADGLVSA